MIWKKRLTALAAALMMLFSAASAEVIFLPQVSGWTAKNMPLRLTAGVEIISEASSGETRLQQLQALMKHLSLQIDFQQLQDESWSRVHVMVDDAPAIALRMREMAEETLLQGTGLPDTTCRTASATGDPLSLLTGGQTEDLSFYGMKGEGARWLADAEACIAGLEAALAPYGSAKKVDTAIKNMGKAKLKTTFTIPSEEAALLTGLLAPLCPEGPLKALMSRLVFSGKQQFLLYQNGDGAIIKVTYEGKCGVSEKDMRNTTLSWSLRREDDHTRDTFTLKTPAVSGSDRNNVSFSRVAKVTEGGTTTVQVDARLETVVDKQMTSWECEADLKTAPKEENVLLTGEFVLRHTTPDDVTRKLILTPDLLLGAEDVPYASGHVTVKSTRASYTELEAKVNLSLTEGDYFNWELTGETVDLDKLGKKKLAALQEQLLSGAATSLVRHIALLPTEDAAYLFADLDEEAVAEIVRISREALQEEEAR